ncbi:MAG: ATP-binding cassette domain-containing protein, partial [Candidatus Brocadiales bacterium]|nr:ATP-binding cassette domain-containing protein [Candidatus Bathyanammoxibius sp.]
GGMLRPTEGQVIADGSDIYAMNERDRARFRAKNIGFIFQLFHLVPYLNIIENVSLPAGVVKNRSGPTDAGELLKRLNLSERECHKPLELSAGEKQRTAIARALLNQPRIILADEPTGNLDPENAERIFGYLAEFQRSGGTVIVVTHGTAADRFADRIIHLIKGRIEESLKNE